MLIILTRLNIYLFFFENIKIVVILICCNGFSNAICSNALDASSLTFCDYVALTCFH